MVERDNVVSWNSFRDSFKGLVALEIIIDLPIGFPIKNIISLVSWKETKRKINNDLQ